MTWVLTTILNWVGGGVLDRVLGHLEKRAESATERLRIETLREHNANTVASSVVIAGMQHRMFWVAWSIAAMPLAAWFGWGVMDTLFNGALPDVATLPPQLKIYADTVWGNIFYTGAGVAAASAIANAVKRR